MRKPTLAIAIESRCDLKLSLRSLVPRKCGSWKGRPTVIELDRRPARGRQLFKSLIVRVKYGSKPYCPFRSLVLSRLDFRKIQELKLGHATLHPDQFAH